jgi:hypothetical protein
MYHTHTHTHTHTKQSPAARCGHYGTPHARTPRTLAVETMHAIRHDATPCEAATGPAAPCSPAYGTGGRRAAGSAPSAAQTTACAGRQMTLSEAPRHSMSDLSGEAATGSGGRGAGGHRSQNKPLLGAGAGGTAASGAEPARGWAALEFAGTGVGKNSSMPRPAMRRSDGSPNEDDSRRRNMARSLGRVMRCLLSLTDVLFWGVHAPKCAQYPRTGWGTEKPCLVARTSRRPPVCLYSSRRRHPLPSVTTIQSWKQCPTS